MPNPLEKYRKLQREIRKPFDAFTSVRCETCRTPCCRKPVAVDATDMVLAESFGWQPPEGKNMHEDLFKLLDANTLAGNVPVTDDIGQPCDFLGERGCSFPDDLRPLRCTTFICGPMRETLPPEEIARLEKMALRLTAARRELADVLYSDPRPRPPSRRRRR